MIRLYHPLSKFNDRKFLQALGVLDEANVGGVLTEAATAQVEAVLADDTVGVGAHAAATDTQQRSARRRRRWLCTRWVTLRNSASQLWSWQPCTPLSRATQADLAQAYPLGLR